jgi:CheY-like chemotaxis protein/DNA-binding MarR family transcriptional regulator
MDVPRVILVEDDPACAEGLRETLTDSGYGVLWAANPAEALEKLAGDDRVGVAVLDFKLPELDGVRLFARLREAAGPRGASLQAVLCSGAAGPADLNGAMRSGIAAFVAKPIDRFDLLSAVETAAGRYRELEHHRQLRASLTNRYRQIESALAEVTREVATLTAPPPAPPPSPGTPPATPGLDRAWHALHCRRLLDEARLMDRLFAENAIDAVEWRVLLALREADLGPGAAPTTNIAADCGTSPTAGLRRITGLEARGLIERCDDPADGRRALLRLTEAGRRLCRELVETIAARKGSS